jgi:hypothetical protein
MSCSACRLDFCWVCGKNTRESHSDCHEVDFEVTFRAASVSLPALAQSQRVAKCIQNFLATKEWMQQKQDYGAIISFIRMNRERGAGIALSLLELIKLCQETLMWSHAWLAFLPDDADSAILKYLQRELNSQLGRFLPMSLSLGPNPESDMDFLKSARLAILRLANV